MRTDFEDIWDSDIAEFQTGNEFENYLQGNDDNSIYSKYKKDITSLLNSLIYEYSDRINIYQTNALKKLFEEFNKIRVHIDPYRLKDFCSYFNNDDDELVLYRNSKDGIINIIINSEECISYSYLKKNDRYEFYTITIDGDFEKLAYDFFK